MLHQSQLTISGIAELVTILNQNLNRYVSLSVGIVKHTHRDELVAEFQLSLQPGMHGEQCQILKFQSVEELTDWIRETTPQLVHLNTPAPRKNANANAETAAAALNNAKQHLLAMTK